MSRYPYRVLAALDSSLYPHDRMTWMFNGHGFLDIHFAKTTKEALHAVCSREIPFPHCVIIGTHEGEEHELDFIWEMWKDERLSRIPLPIVVIADRERYDEISFLEFQERVRLAGGYAVVRNDQLESGIKRISEMLDIYHYIPPRSVPECLVS